MKSKSKKRKKEMTRRQKKLLKEIQCRRQLDSNNLRDIIKGKLEWAKAEKRKGESTIKQIRIQINRLDGIILFINDLLQPLEEEKK